MDLEQWLRLIDGELSRVESASDSPANRGRILGLDGLRRVLRLDPSLHPSAIPLILQRQIADWSHRDRLPDSYRTGAEAALTELGFYAQNRVILEDRE